MFHVLTGVWLSNHTDVSLFNTVYFLCRHTQSFIVVCTAGEIIETCMFEGVSVGYVKEKNNAYAC